MLISNTLLGNLLKEVKRNNMLITLELKKKSASFQILPTLPPQKFTNFPRPVLVRACQTYFKHRGRYFQWRLYLWPYLGKPGLTKTPLNRFSISTHFGNVRMHYRSFSMHLKTLTTFANENEMHWRSFWIHFESFAPRFKTFTTHFSEAVSHWKTFTKVQTTQQNTRTLNTLTKSMNMHCVLIEQQML